METQQKPTQTLFSNNWNWKGIAMIVITFLGTTLQERNRQNAELKQQNIQLSADVKYLQAKYFDLAEGRGADTADTAKRVSNIPSFKQMLRSDTPYIVRFGVPVRDSAHVDR